MSMSLLKIDNFCLRFTKNRCAIFIEYEDVDHMPHDIFIYSDIDLTKTADVDKTIKLYNDLMYSIEDYANTSIVELTKGYFDYI